MKTLVLFFAILATAFAVLFVADLRGFFNATANPVAFLQTSAGTVKRLAKDQLTWDRAQSGSLFGSGDTISTGEESGAKLVFYAGGELELEAGAMVVLAGTLEELKLNFVTGSGKVRLAKKAQGKIAVTRGNKVASAKPAAKPATAAKIVASAKTPGSPTTTGAGNTPVSESASPAASGTATTVADAGSLAPEVAGKSGMAVADAGSLAPDVAGKSAANLADAGSLAPNAPANLAPTSGAAGAGTAAPETDAGAGIEVAVVDDIAVPPPPPATNLNEANHAIEEKRIEAASKVATAPRAEAGVRKPAGEKTSDPASADPAASSPAAPLTGSTFAGPAIQEKSIRHPEQSLSAASATGNLGGGSGELITVAKLPPVPEIRFPANDAVIDLSNGQVPRLQWDLPKEIAEAEKQISFEIVLRPAEGKGEEKVLRSQTPELPLSQISRGKYLWSVRAVDAKGKRGPASEPRWLEVKVPAQIARPVVLPVRVIDE